MRTEWNNDEFRIEKRKCFAHKFTIQFVSRFYKYDYEITSIKWQVCVFVFVCICVEREKKNLFFSPLRHFYCDRIDLKNFHFFLQFKPLYNLIKNFFFNFWNGLSILKIMSRGNSFLINNLKKIKLFFPFWIPLFHWISKISQFDYIQCIWRRQKQEKEKKNKLKQRYDFNNTIGKILQLFASFLFVCLCLKIYRINFVF